MSGVALNHRWVLPTGRMAFPAGKDPVHTGGPFYIHTYIHMHFKHSSMQYGGGGGKGLLWQWPKFCWLVALHRDTT